MGQAGGSRRAACVVGRAHERRACRVDEVAARAAHRRAGARLSKKNGGVLCEEPVVKYAAIAAHAGVYAVAFMCRVLGVAPSGFYAWLKRPTSERAQRDEALQPHVRAAFQASKQRYGSPRIHAELQAQGHRVGRKRVARLMREAGLRARARRRYRHTTLSKHREPLAPNVVAREFEVAAPNQVWVSDLTYLPTQTGFAYLAVILDLFARR